MLNITSKTTRQELISEIDNLRASALTHENVLAERDEEHAAAIDKIEAKLLESRTEVQNLKHRAEVLETDVHNLLGALRVMADSSRTVRIRARSVQSADMATALPYRNTDKL